MAGRIRMKLFHLTQLTKKQNSLIELYQTFNQHRQDRDYDS
jgi:hypothetical protein